MSKTKKSCNSGFDNITHCQRRTAAYKVKELAGDCGIDTNIFNTKPKQCEELLRKQGGGLKKKYRGARSKSKSKRYRRNPRKTRKV